MPTTSLADDFLTRWEHAVLTGAHRFNMERVYPLFFTGRSRQRTYAIIAAHHHRLVTAGDWSEQELADVLHRLMNAGSNLSVRNVLEARSES